MQAQKVDKHLIALLCQLKPELKKKQQNITRVSKSMEMYDKSSKLDIVLFPEMSFVGYNFENFEDALPYAVKCGEGEQFQFCINLAKRVNSYVAFGYIQKQEVQGNTKLYNSAAVLDRKGNLLLNYRKTFLYFCDSLWCQQGDGFKSLEITNLKGQKFKCVLAICMDINPKNFTSGEYELAEFALKEKAEVILFITNWVDSSAQSVQDSAVIAMYEYWAHRLRPMLSTQQERKRPFLFLAADRVGKEYSYFDKKETQFFGSSCGIMFNDNYLIKKLDKKDEGYLKIAAKLPL